jgi:hypothetical protein
LKAFKANGIGISVKDSGFAPNSPKKDDLSAILSITANAAHMADFNKQKPFKFFQQMI